MNLGMPEMIFIFLLALVIFGPRKLPELGKQLGKALNEFKRASNEFKYQLESEIKGMDDGADLVSSARDIHATLTRPVGQTVFNTLMSAASVDEGRKIQPPKGDVGSYPVSEPLTTNPAAIEAAQAIAAEIQAARMKNWQAQHPEAAAAKIETQETETPATPVEAAREPNV
jgi:sec-independent protein translocase protein TatB